MGYEICKCVMRDENRKAIPGYILFEGGIGNRTRIGGIIKMYLFTLEKGLIN